MKPLTAFYDLEHGPVSFDFVTWLVRAMKERDRRCCDGLHVVVVPKENGVGGFSRDWGGHDEHDARWRLWHIVVASCPLAASTVTLASSKAHAERMRIAECWWPEGRSHFMGPLVEAARRGEEIPKLRSTEAARRYVERWLAPINAPVVTLTLRFMPRDPARNSNVASWEHLRDAVVAKGYAAIWLDDSSVALGRGKGYAELDPDLRLALYERAGMNFIANNGPQELLKFSAAPYRAFGQGLDGWEEHFRKHFNMEVGEQLPWAGPQQKLVYAPDSADVLIEEFKAWAGEAKSVSATSS